MENLNKLKKAELIYRLEELTSILEDQREDLDSLEELKTLSKRIGLSDQAKIEFSNVLENITDVKVQVIE